MALAVGRDDGGTPAAHPGLVVAYARQTFSCGNSAMNLVTEGPEPSRSAIVPLRQS
jgi:hypothetical protein